MPRQYSRSSYYRGGSYNPYARSYGSYYSYSSSYQSSTRSYASNTRTSSASSKKDLIWTTDAKENYKLGTTDLEALTPADYVRKSRNARSGTAPKYDRKEVVDLVKRLNAGHGLPHALRIAMKSEEEFATPNGPQITRAKAMKDHQLTVEQFTRIKPISKKFIARFKAWSYTYNLYDVQALAAQGLNLRRGIFEPEPFGPKPDEAAKETTTPEGANKGEEENEGEEEDYDNAFEDEDPFGGMSQEEIDAMMAGEAPSGCSQESHAEPLQDLN